MLGQVTAQLSGQLPALEAGRPAALVLIPAVGFGQQSARVLDRTLRLLTAQRTPVATTAVVLVNRPRDRPPDGTEALARAWACGARPAGQVPVAVAHVEVPHTPRLGELRQLLVDATTQLLRPCTHSTTLVLADDDLVDAPPTYVHRLCAHLARHPGVDLALGPVLFDDRRFPTALLAELFVGDVLRALLAARFADDLARLDAAEGEHRAAIQQLSAEAFESMALSGNLGLRLSALEQAGGFRDLNEITNVVRDVQALALAHPKPHVVTSPGSNTIGSVWVFDPDDEAAVEELLAVAVRVSSRRALAAFLEGRHPTVAQWKARRFHAGRVDPVRVHEPPPFAVRPVRGMPAAEREAVLRGIEAAVATTLGYFPAWRTPVRDCLRALGLGPEQCTAQVRVAEGCQVAEGRPPAGGAQRWSVRIHDPRGLLGRIQAAQDAVLERLGLPLDAPVLLPLERAAPW